MAAHSSHREIATLVTPIDAEMLQTILAKAQPGAIIEVCATRPPSLKVLQPNPRLVDQLGEEPI